MNVLTHTGATRRHALRLQEKRIDQPKHLVGFLQADPYGVHGLQRTTQTRQPQAFERPRPTLHIE